MKKKEKNRKNQDMPDFAFKEFTAEENRIYTEAVDKFRESLRAGETLKQAYEGYAIDDKELEALVRADFLKILIAERHFAGGESLEDLAKSLDVTRDLIAETRARMLQEVGMTAADQFTQEHGGITPKTND